jgi:hypothetical protein
MAHEIDLDFGAKSPTFFVGQRIKFIDDELFDPRVGDGFEVRGRITYINAPLVQVLVDGKSFARWLHLNQIMPEGAGR